ncbi:MULTISPECIES: PepSY domain-containing protein [Chitinophagaceae]
MIISVWRYSHFCLAVSSFILLTIAALTGMVLAFEPITENAQGFRVDHFDTVTLAHTIPVLKEKIPGIESLQVDDYHFVTAKYPDKNGHDKTVYVNPVNGDILGVTRKQSPFFEWVTNLHRSLFLHETGRFIVGIIAFLLILIVLSGIGLIVQRQKGFRRFFAPIEKTSFAQYYHTVLGRWSLIFILVIALTGTYMSLSRFVLKPVKESIKVDDSKIKDEPQVALKEFSVFQQTRLENVEDVQFPFSDFPEDYYILKLKDREIGINQFTGEVLAQQYYSKAQMWTDFSLRWHTGRANVVWAGILAISSGYILFFIYSGLWIAWTRTRGKIKNRFKPDSCTTIILVGSENGSTYRFASSVFQQLLKQGEKVYLADLDTYSVYPQAKQLLVLTSTYGEGDPPSNAKKFLGKVATIPQQQKIHFSTIGFGSRNYQHFCGFAQEVDYILREQGWAEPLLDLYLVNEKSPQDFGDWMVGYNKATNRQLSLPNNLLLSHTKNLEKITVTNRTDVDSEGAFLISMACKHFGKINSGDLLAIYPQNDALERLYSIGKVKNNIQLSVKLHEHGIGSQYLYRLQIGDTIDARIVKNQHFHFPKKASNIIMVSNGTGIAPFLGMLADNGKKIPCKLYCGFRTGDAFQLYKPILDNCISENKLEQYILALSRENEKQYVSHLMEKDAAYIAEILNNKGIVMICGSLSMQKDVMAVLEKICQENSLPNIEMLVDNNQIVMDCY